MEKRYLEQKNLNTDIDVIAIMKSLWRRRWFIVLFTLVCSVGAVLIALLMKNTYESTGVLEYGSLHGANKVAFRYGQSKPDYRKIESRLMNKELFSTLVENETSLSEGKKGEISSQVNRSSGELAKGIVPIYSNARDDARLQGRAIMEKDESISVIGFRLSWQDSSPEEARKMVLLLARHIKNQMAYGFLYNFINETFLKNSAELRELDNERISAEFTLERLQKKLEEIRLLVKRYPNVDTAENRQLVSTQEGGYRYLPPANQALGIESLITDVKQELLITERKRKLALIGYEFYKALATELKNDPSGEFLLTKYDEQVNQLAQSPDLTDDTAREFYNNVAILNEMLKNTFNQTYRFISEPNLPSRHIKPRRSIIVLVVTFLSFFIALFIALIVHWLKNQKNVVVPG